MAEATVGLGARTSVCERSVEKLRDITHDLCEQVHAQQCDISDSEQAARWLDQFQVIEHLVVTEGDFRLCGIAEVNYESIGSLFEQRFRGVYKAQST